MKVNIRVDTERDEMDEIIGLIKHLYNKDQLVNSQMKIDSDNNKESNKEVNNKVRKYFCNNPDCKKEITKDIVAYCLHKDNKDRFGGKVFCRDCQEGK